MVVENEYLQLVHAAQVERKRLPKFTVPKSFNSVLLSVNHKAATILNRCGVKNVGTPYQVFSNEGCLFDSVSVSLIDSQQLSLELRVYTCLESIKDRVLSLPIATDLLMVYPNYIASVFTCAKAGGYSSTLTSWKIPPLSYKTRNQDKCIGKWFSKTPLTHPKTFSDLKCRNRAKKKDKPTATIIADEMLHVLEMVKDHPFVQKVEEQMVDFQHFLKTVESPRVGIDRTFNLGSFYVAAFVYKNHRVVKTDSNDHPVFLGPVLLHKEASFEVYHYFLSHVNARLASTIDHIDIRIPQAMDIGSDDEKALTKSIQMCFPEAKRSLCTKHLKDNVSEYLKNKIGVNNSERHNVVEKIFGSAGVLDANDTFEFEERSDFLLSDLNMYPSFRQYYDRTLKPKLLLNIQNLAKTDRG